MPRIGAAVTITLMILALSALGSQAVAESSKVRWFQAKLASGETEGYHWSVGAKGPKYEPLSQLCTQVSIIEPPRNDVPYVEGQDAADCGRLRVATDAVSSVESLGSNRSGVTVLEALYRPLIRKVAVDLAGGERKFYRTRVPQLSNRSDRGIPMFRYVVASLKGGDCIRRLIAFDGKGKVVSKQTSPPCPPGTS
jgi:hypothetical protein